MKGYYLFRGDLLVAYNEDTRSAGGLHEKGMAGDILVYLGKGYISTFEWMPPSVEHCWGNKIRQKTDKYRLLVLLQK